jgi:serine/threonine protein kinase
MDDGSDEIDAGARVGSTVGGRWRLHQLVGVGGMGAVYRATNIEVESEAAIKILLRRFASNNEVKQRFHAEGRIANKVHHPGAVRVVDMGTTEDGCPYLLMEYLHGASLQAHWEAQGRTLDSRDALEIAVKLLDVLATAHKAGVVHRDIKPDNIFLTSAGELKVLDFGIARLQEVTQPASGERFKTRFGAPMGTAGFMAPEQALGRWNDVDARTDLWAVGATLFALLTGKTVDEQEGSALGQTPSLGTRLPALDTRVVKLVDRALALQREERWPDAVTMQTAITAILADLPPNAPAPGRDGAVATALPSTSTELARGPIPTPTEPDEPAGFEKTEPAPTPPMESNAPVGPLTEPDAHTATERADDVPTTMPPALSAETRTAIGVPAVEDLKRVVQSPVVGGSMIVTHQPSKPPEVSTPHAKLGTRQVAILILAVATVGLTLFLIVRGGSTRESNPPDAGPSPAPTIIVTEDPGPSIQPPLVPPPQPTITSTGPVPYEGAPCQNGHVINSVQNAGVIREKYCDGHCGSVGLPETGCKLNTCEPCKAPNVVPGCMKPGTLQACLIQSCKEGFKDCNEKYGDGCETDLTSVDTCGDCKIKCSERSNASRTCRVAKCSFDCNDGFDDCDKSPPNGCEVNLKTSLDHCGKCNKPCTPPKNADATCSGGTCGFICKSDYGDCDASPTNGCETSLKTSLDHCGKCSKPCMAPENMNASCTTGTCSTACKRGFGDCDQNLSNGCETKLGSTLHCGKCGVSCTQPSGGSVSCEDGRCKPQCPAGSPYKAETNECVAPPPPPPPPPPVEPNAPPPQDAGL